MGQKENPLFLAKDVAEWIEYDGTSVSSMCKLVDKDEVVKMFCTLSYSNNHPKQVISTGSANRLFLTEDEKEKNITPINNRGNCFFNRRDEKAKGNNNALRSSWIQHKNITLMIKLVDEDEKLTYTICNAGQGRKWIIDLLSK